MSVRQRFWCFPPWLDQVEANLGTRHRATPPDRPVLLSTLARQGGKQGLRHCDDRILWLPNSLPPGRATVESKNRPDRPQPPCVKERYLGNNWTAFSRDAAQE